MNLNKNTVRYLNSQPCFACKYSQIDSFDFGLRCCNGDSEHCTEYCPDTPCEHLDIDPEFSPRLKAIRDLSEAGKTPRVFSRLQTIGIDKLELHGEQPHEED